MPIKGGMSPGRPPPITPDMVEAAAKAIYDAEPYFEAGEYVEGFLVSPGGYLSWEQAKARDAEFEGDGFMIPITQFAYRAARAALEAVAVI